MQKLKYEKINNSNEVITIDLHNGYSVIAITGFDAENKVYITTIRSLFIIFAVYHLPIYKPCYKARKNSYYK